jgi:hypothetical protein
VLVQRGVLLTWGASVFVSCEGSDVTLIHSINPFPRQKSSCSHPCPFTSDSWQSNRRKMWQDVFPRRLPPRSLLLFECHRRWFVFGRSGPLSAPYCTPRYTRRISAERRTGAESRREPRERNSLLLLLRALANWKASFSHRLRTQNTHRDTNDTGSFCFRMLLKSASLILLVCLLIKSTAARIGEFDAAMHFDLFVSSAF